MITPQPGQRIQLNNNPECHIRILGRDAERLGVAAINSQGAVLPFEEGQEGSWYLSSFASLGDQFEIIAYIVDDRSGGFVNQSYPIQMEISGEQYALPAPDGQLAAIILSEIYVKARTRRMKVSNEGYTFGIEAYLRARNLASVTMPFRQQKRARTEEPDQPPPFEPDRHRPSAAPGQVIGTGSGIIVAPDLVITNAHVIEDGESFRQGRTQNFLRPVAVDPKHDLALLEGSTNGQPLPMRIGAPIWLGESVMAAGFPLMHVLGADLKVTTGNISGLTGNHGDISRFQFTAPIGSGSSGGAIVDEYGNLVGVTSASLAHGNMRERGSISENVNFGIRSSFVFEMIAAAGFTAPTLGHHSENNRREVVNRLRASVVSIIVSA
ncbi:serine protease [Sphingobium sp. H39-3-25]|uniref:S1C family serine protease n=1 Tax=Sphingobium arseniciresistens TaxID=3030834 RepID=UPI0023B94147|nr:serine protease [Sphingobium arseniciresistens]